jgi:hypothetical protein
MLAAISVTVLSSRACALIGSAMISRRRRSRERGPAGGPRMIRYPQAGLKQAALRLGFRPRQTIT